MAQDVIDEVVRGNKKVIHQGEKLINDGWALEQKYLKIKDNIKNMPHQLRIQDAKNAYKYLHQILILDNDPWYQQLATSDFADMSDLDTFKDLREMVGIYKINSKDIKKFDKSNQNILNHLIKQGHHYYYQNPHNKQIRPIITKDLLNYFWNFIQEISSVQDNINDIALDPINYFNMNKKEVAKIRKSK